MIYHRMKLRIVSLQFKAAVVRHKARPATARTRLLRRLQRLKRTHQTKTDRRTLAQFDANEVETHHGLPLLLVSACNFLFVS